MSGEVFWGFVFPSAAQVTTVLLSFRRKSSLCRISFGKQVGEGGCAGAQDTGWPAGSIPVGGDHQLRLIARGSLAQR
jgi:hypothetical protein